MRGRHVLATFATVMGIAGCRTAAPEASDLETGGDAPGVVTVHVGGRLVDCRATSVIHTARDIELEVRGAVAGSVRAEVDGRVHELGGAPARLSIVVEEARRTAVRVEAQDAAGERIECIVHATSSAELDRLAAELVRESSTPATLRGSDRTGAHSLFAGTLAVEGDTASERALAFAARFAPLFGAPASQLVLDHVAPQAAGSLVVLRQEVGGARVYGAELSVVIDEAGRARMAHGLLSSDAADAEAPTIDADAARAVLGEGWQDADVSAVIFDEVLVTGRGEPGARAGFEVVGEPGRALLAADTGEVVERRGSVRRARVELHEIADPVWEPLLPSFTISGHHLIAHGESGDSMPTLDDPAAVLTAQHQTLFSWASRAADYYSTRGLDGFPAFTPRRGSRWQALPAGTVRLAIANDIGNAFFADEFGFIVVDMDAYGTMADVFCHEYAHAMDARGGGEIGNNTLSETIADLAAMHCGPALDPRDDPWQVGEASGCAVRSTRSPTAVGGISSLSGTCLPNVSAVTHYSGYDDTQYHEGVFITTLALFHAHNRYGMPTRSTEQLAVDALQLGSSMRTLPDFRDWWLARARTLGMSANELCGMARGFESTGLTGELGGSATSGADLVCSGANCPLCDGATGEASGASVCDTAAGATCIDVLGHEICHGDEGYRRCSSDAGELAALCTCENGALVCECRYGRTRSASCDPAPELCGDITLEGGSGRVARRSGGGCSVGVADEPMSITGPVGLALLALWALGRRGRGSRRSRHAVSPRDA